MVQKHGVNGFPRWVIATERKTDVGYAARNLSVGQILFDPTSGIDEINGVVVMLFNTSGDGKNIGVKNNIFRRESDFICQQSVCTLANFNFAFIRIRLTFFIKSHHDHSGAITTT